MVKRRQVYKCDVCGIVIEVLESGAGEPVCCGQVMNLLGPRAAARSADVHVPIASREDGLVRVAVGHQPHPMDAKHYIQWIELVAGPLTQRRFLEPGQRAESTFIVPPEQDMQVRQMCNLHGLWKK